MIKVLIIEDEIPLREALVLKLKKEGFEPIGAKDGAEGIEAARTQKPDLIFLDILMPKMNGLDVLKELKTNAALVNTPIIILTNLPEESARQKAKELGAAEYLVKSNSPLELLIEKVKKYTQGK
jgi:DNA-binding response OmpR family regulator